MKMFMIWLVAKLLDLTYPYGIIPLILSTWMFPWLAIAWGILGILGFIFGLCTWKYYVSRRDKWENGEMGLYNDRMSMAFLRLREACYLGSSIFAGWVIYCII